ncbi:hypothetical protein BN14_10305 [Rhizoctonia solani AG-1 IB]|uniref:Centrosomin N-terminal motif 1 domain-containing protein n=1 Tax=Thanatephorus cucumeris (strain AG1-IB / isolate 7/3/14) TaxID=1108050 RepID=M5CGI5_THACB|nr:hypothetical protein BN14_10305 [Rhizoctonia solani AG-1 IB]
MLSLPHDVSFGSYQSSIARNSIGKDPEISAANTKRGRRQDLCDLVAREKWTGDPGSHFLTTTLFASPRPPLAYLKPRRSLQTVTGQDDSPEVCTPKGPSRINIFALCDIDDSLDQLDSPIAIPDKEKRSLLLDSTNCQSTTLEDSKTNATDKGPTMMLREQEKLIDRVKRENFALKLKVHFLEERLNLLK